MSDNAIDKFDHLATEIFKAKELKDWLCPECKMPVNIIYEKYGHNKMGLRVICSRCFNQVNLDGEFPVPEWYSEYKYSFMPEIPKRRVRAHGPDSAVQRENRKSSIVTE